MISFVSRKWTLRRPSRIHVPGPLRTYCAGAAQLSISARTVRAALEELERRQAALYRNVCDETGHGAPAHERVRERGQRARPRRARHAAGAGRRRHDPARRLRRLNDAGSSHSHHRNQEGPVRRRGGEAAAQLRAARAVRPGRRRVLDADRHARHAAPLRLELQSVLRHEGAALDRPRQELQGDEVGAGLPEGRRARAGQHLVARAGQRQEGPVVRRRAGVAVPEPATAAIRGRWCPASATTSTRASGSPATAGSACTRSSATAIACTSASRPAATT